MERPTNLFPERAGEELISQMNVAIDGMMSGEDESFFRQALWQYLNRMPALRLVEELDRCELLESFAEIVISLAKPEIIEATKLFPGRGNDMFEGLDKKQQFLICLLWIKDVTAGKHSIAVHVMARWLEKWDSVAKLMENGGATLLRRAASVHDIGKLQVPGLVLDNPFPGQTWLPMLLKEISDPKRATVDPPIAIKSPFTLSSEQAIQFGPMLRGENVAPSVVDDFTQLALRMDEDRRVNIKEALPINAVLNTALHVIGHGGRMPDEVCRFVPEELHSVGPRVLQELSAQIPWLMDRRKILTEFGMHGWRDSFMGAIRRHELGTAQHLMYVNGGNLDSLVGLAAQHHRYEETAVANPELATNMSEQGVTLIELLRMLDIIEALDSERSYKPPFQIGRIRKILDFEVKDRNLPPGLVAACNKQLLATDDPNAAGAMGLIAKNLGVVS